MTYLGKVSEATKSPKEGIQFDGVALGLEQ